MRKPARNLRREMRAGPAHAGTSLWRDLRIGEGTAPGGQEHLPFGRYYQPPGEVARTAGVEPQNPMLFGPACGAVRSTSRRGSARPSRQMGGGATNPYLMGSHNRPAGRGETLAALKQSGGGYASLLEPAAPPARAGHVRAPDRAR